MNKSALAMGERSEFEVKASQALGSISAWRASQIDASQVGDEVFSLLFSEQRLYALCKYSFGIPQERIHEFLAAVVRPSIEFLTLGSSNCTIGQQILGLQFTSSTAPVGRLGRIQRLVYVLCKYALPNWLDRINSSDEWQRGIRTFVRGLNVLLFCRFLGTGECKDVAEWLSGLSVAGHQISKYALVFDWMERQLVLDALGRAAELALRVWPLLRPRAKLSGKVRNLQCPVCEMVFEAVAVVVKVEPCGHCFCHWCCWETGCAVQCGVCSERVMRVVRFN